MRMRKPQELHPLELAYIGDAVYELYVRTHLIKSGVIRPNNLQKAAIDYVSAVSQARRGRRLESILTEEEMDVLRRGRNAKSGHVPKNASVGEYRYSTGLEALIGYLYLTGQEERLNSIIEILLKE